jgi:hypothetical protein
MNRFSLSRGAHAAFSFIWVPSKVKAARTARCDRPQKLFFTVARKERKGKKVKEKEKKCQERTSKDKKRPKGTKRDQERPKDAKKDQRPGELQTAMSGNGT